MNTYINPRNLHLIISIAVLVPAALMYGLLPDIVLPILLDINVDSVDVKNIFRAIMCLYLGIVWFLVLGVAKTEYWKASTMINMFFMGGLALGRMLSLLIDGKPSLVFELGMIGELILSLFSYWQLRSFRKV